jgi:hypothetical protein
MNRREGLKLGTATLMTSLLPISSSVAAQTESPPKEKAMADNTAIRPFHFEASQADLADLRRRVSATKWPEREQVSDATQGVQLATVQKLAQYWATQHDWRKCEAKINAVYGDQWARHPFHARSFEARKCSLGGPAPARLSPDEKRAWDQLDDFFKNGLSYAIEMNNRPQTLYGLVDSPVGLAAWMIDHDIRSYQMIARVFDGKPEGLTRDDVLDNVTLYWLTNTAISSARLYWDTSHNLTGGFFDARGIKIPVAMLAFADLQLRTVWAAADSVPAEKRGIFLERVFARLQLHHGFTDSDLDDAVCAALTGLIQSAA